MGSKKKPKIIQQNKKETSPQVKGEEMPAGKEQEASRGSVPSGSKMDRKAPVPRSKASRAEHSKKGTKERTNSDIVPERGDVKHKKRKAKEAAPAPPTEYVSATSALRTEAQRLHQGLLPYGGWWPHRSLSITLP